MKGSLNHTTWCAGIAIFSMFFGAGNVVFPLALGQIAGDQIPLALVGLFLTSIGGPLLGLLGATLYKGNCKEFFNRPGAVIGFIFISSSFLLLGPLAVLPRCFVVAHAALDSLLPGTTLFSFSLIFGALSLLCCIRKTTIIPLLGYVLSPLLLFSLFCIIVSGISSGSTLDPVSFGSKEAFIKGLEIGYDTMDLIASIFFSSSIWMLLLLRMQKDGEAPDERALAKTVITSSIIGGTLLGIVYVGLALSAAYHSQVLTQVPLERLMTTLSYHLLGPYFGAIANIAVGLACFTTIVSLTLTLTDLCCREFFPGKLNYQAVLVGMIGLTIAFSNLGFETIMAIIHPAISLCYPAIIALTLCNILHKLYGWRSVKRPVYATLAIASIFQTVQFIP